MLNQIIAFSIKNKLIIGLLVLTLIGYGLYQITKLPIDAVPDITNNQVQVITTTPALGAPDVERLITFPIEQANSNIPGLKEIRSFSRFGLSLITIVFDDDVDIYWARQQVTERLKLAENQIPKGIGTPELAPVTTGLGEIYQYVLKAKHGYENKYNTTELRTIQDWIVRRQLLSVKGVANVSSFGGRVKQYEIAINPNKLKAHGITISDVFTALEKNNENTGGAYLEKTSTVLYIRTEGLIENIADIKNIVVKSTASGTPLLINDVAEVRIGNATRYGAITYNDEGEVAGAVVMMLKGDNSSRVIKDVKEKITQIQKTLPKGVEIEPFLDRTKMVNSAIGTVSKNLLEGALIVILILVLFLGNLRAGLIVASVIPLAMLFAIIMMNMFGVSGNLMSLGALDFGLIVDGAVIIVEACMFQLYIAKQKMFTQNQMDEIVYNTATRMRNAAVFGELIILAVYLPIFTLEGIEGKMFKPMAQTVAFALLGAFILSLTYIPMMTALFLNKNVSHKKNISDKMMEVLENIHQKYLLKLMNIPKIMIGFVVALFAVSLFILSTLGGEFIPELPEGDFAVETRVLTGSNLNTTVESCLKAAHVLKTKFPEVEKIISKIGSGEIPTDPMPMEGADLMIILKDKSEWTSAKTWDELSAKMSEALQDVPGVTFGFQFPVAMRFNELMTGAKQDVVCKIFGENLDTLSKYSKLLGDVANKIDGAENVYVEPVDGLPQVIINYKRNIIAQYGLNIQDINKIVNTAFAGQSSGLVYEDEKRFELVVRLAGEQRQNLEDVQNLLIPTPAGTQIPLYQLADVAIKESVNQIQREDAKRRIIIGFNVSGRDVQSIVTDLQTQINKQIKLPSGYYVSYGGAFENLLAAKKRLSLAVPIALLFIFILLYFAFNSVKHGLLIYSAIPLSAIGGILFLALRGMPFSISAGIGFIALFGVAVLNGIVLISEYNRIKKDGETDLKQIVLIGTKHRLRPVLMTALVASLGFLPMALSHGAGAEVQRPLATVVIGGLLIATLLTLFVLPILYIIFENGLFKSNKIKPNVVVIILILLGFSNFAKAQNITLQAALDTAIKNNLNVKRQKLKAAYQQQLTKTAYTILPTNIVAETGNYNSAYLDNRIGLSQNFSLPTVYNKQKTLLNQQYKTANWAVTVKEEELKKNVAETYFNILYLQEKEKLLQESDTIFSEFLKKATLRLAKGESNILEKTTAQTQITNVKLQLKQLLQDKSLLLLQFQLLLNTNNTYTLNNDFYRQIAPQQNISLINQHPLLKIIAQQKEVSIAQTATEKAKLLPDVNLGVFSTTIRGIGANEIFYNGAKRFQSAQIGLNIPLFVAALKAKIKAAKIYETEVTNDYLIQEQVLQNKYKLAILIYNNSLETIADLEKNALPNAKLIIETANKQFINGDINYLNWVTLTNQAININSTYIDAVKAFNDAVIQLNYLNAKQ